MGKKRKKSLQLNVESAPAPSSQPALTEAAAAAIVAAAGSEETPEPKPATTTPDPTPAVAAVAVASAAPPASEPIAPVPKATPTPVAGATPAHTEATVEEESVATESPPPSEVAAASETAPASEAASEAGPKTARPKKKTVKRKKRSTKPPAVSVRSSEAVTREALDQKIDRLEAKLEVKKEEAAKAAREGFGSNPALDDQSVPPVDLEIHDDFFAAGERPHAPPKEASGAYTALDARHAQKMTAQAVARRAHLSRYVKWAVGAAAGILLLGFTIKSLRGHPNDEPVRHEVSQAAAAQPVEQKVAPAVVEQKPAPVADTTQAPTTDEKTDGTSVATNDAKPDAAVDKTNDTEQVKADMPPEKPKNAWQEKQAAKAALERGSNGAAIAAGERSVALDGSDAESWLVLGAAYQAMHNVGQAKRCFHACISQGKKGPIGDCRDMLSSL